MQRRAGLKASLHLWSHRRNGMSRRLCATCWATAWPPTLSCESWCPSSRRSALTSAYRTHGVPVEHNTLSGALRGPQLEMNLYHLLTVPPTVLHCSAFCLALDTARPPRSLVAHTSRGRCLANQKFSMRNVVAHYTRKISRPLGRASPRDSWQQCRGDMPTHPSIAATYGALPLPSALASHSLRRQRRVGHAKIWSMRSASSGINGAYS